MRGWHRLLTFLKSYGLDSGLGLISLSVVYVLKRYYSLATAEELRWILGPTTLLTESFSGLAFNWHPDSGYLAEDLSVLIAPGCAGVNFLLVCFLVVTFLGVGRVRSLSAKSAVILGAAAAAFALTVLVNALRIAASIALSPGLTQVLGWSFHSAHRYLGTFIYLIALMIVAAGVPALLKGTGNSGWGALRRRGVPMALALGGYLLFTLGVPWLRAGGVSDAFASHAQAVLATSALLTSLAWIASRLARLIRARDRKGRPPAKFATRPQRVAPSIRTNAARAAR